jgi:hypothetical protein
MPEIDASNLEASEVLMQLYNNSKPQTKYLIKLFEDDYELMTLDYAQALLTQTQVFNYLRGRPIKTDFRNFPLLDSTEYDKYNGHGEMQKCINKAYLHKNYIPSKI